MAGQVLLGQINEKIVGYAADITKCPELVSQPDCPIPLWKSPFFKPGVVEGEHTNATKSMLSFYAKMTNSHSPPKEGKISLTEIEP